MFFDSPEGLVTKGEVSYYLDQQDAINEMVDEERRARRWVRRNVLYNSNLVDRADVEAVLSGDDGTARGLKLPEGTKMQEVIGTIPPPSMQFAELFDKEAKYQAIDRISSVGAVLRGEQFRTNTNTTSANITTSAQNMRVDEKSDVIEDGHLQDSESLKAGHTHRRKTLLLTKLNLIRETALSLYSSSTT